MGKAEKVETPPGPEGLPEGFSVRNVSKSDEKDIELYTDAGQYAGYVRIDFHTTDAKITPEEVFSFLTDNKVTVSKKAKVGIAEAIAAYKGGILAPILVAEGKRPVPGTDGKVEWLVPNPADFKHQKATAGRVDYRELNRIVNVRQGQKILRISEPTPGREGKDIFGTVVSSQPGKAVGIRRGKNVDVTEDGREFFAQVTGMVQVPGDQVLVEPQLIVQSDVDLSVGNIIFLGPVKVAGNVLDGFKVRAGKEIEVGGMVEGAILESDSYIRIQGGVAGKEKGRITCKGNLEAKYLSEVVVEAGGDVIIANSITNATVKSLGHVVVSGGGIRGSNVVAQKGLRAPEIGSEMGVRTIVIVGVDYHLKDKLANIERELLVVREAVEKIETALGPLLADGDIVSTLAPEKSEIARRLMGQLDVLVQRGGELARKRDDMLGGMQVGSDMSIEVTKRILPGVAMQIGTCRRTFELEVAGPVKLFPDIERGSIRVSR